jgi:hypothetical protein
MLACGHHRQPSRGGLTLVAVSPSREIDFREHGAPDPALQAAEGALRLADREAGCVTDER